MFSIFGSKRDAKTITDEIKVLETELKGLGGQEDDTNQPQDTNPKITIQIFGSEDANNKGFYINDYKINTHHLDETFSANDQVEHLFKNLVGYIENNNLPKDEQKDKSVFFHKYTETVNIKPNTKKEVEAADPGQAAADPGQAAADPGQAAAEAEAADPGQAAADPGQAAAEAEAAITRGAAAGAAAGAGGGKKKKRSRKRNRKSKSKHRKTRKH
jgi:hypothetical protein